MIASNWKFTFDPAGTPRVLLDYGQKIMAEPAYTLDQTLEVVPLVDAAAPFLRLGKNAVVSFQLEIVTDLSTDALARAAVMASIIAAQTAARKPLRIEAYGVTATYWQFANAVIKQHVPRRHMEAPVARTITTWSITATGLTATAVP
jgi:hypothetical protein